MDESSNINQNSENQNEIKFDILKIDRLINRNKDLIYKEGENIF